MHFFNYTVNVQILYHLSLLFILHHLTLIFIFYLYKLTVRLGPLNNACMQGLVRNRVHAGASAPPRG